MAHKPATFGADKRAHVLLGGKERMAGHNPPILTSRLPFVSLDERTG
jgi:hypothetical protein